MARFGRRFPIKPTINRLIAFAPPAVPGIIGRALSVSAVSQALMTKQATAVFSPIIKRLVIYPAPPAPPPIGKRLVVSVAAVRAGTISRATAVFKPNIVRVKLGIVAPATVAVYATIAARVQNTRYDYLVPLHNFQASVDPGVSDDETRNYAPGSVWVNKSSGSVWTCARATAGAARWISLASNDQVILATQIFGG